MEVLRENNLKRKSCRYLIRAEIEEIVKEKSIDRSTFYEYPKVGYRKIKNKFYYSFVDYEVKAEADATAVIKSEAPSELDYCWLNFRDNLKKTASVSEDIGWVCMLGRIKDRLVYDWDDKIYLILSQGWVYEGYIDSIIEVLSETDGLLDDFYVVSRGFDRFAAYSDDTGCLTFYEK